MSPTKKVSSPLIPSWFRRVVPQGYTTGTITLTGTSALLMNCPDVDREGELYQAFTVLSRKTGKTPDDEARLHELEWEVRVYLDPKIGPFIPGRVIKGVLANAGGKWKKGAAIARSLITIESRIPLEYDGPRDQQGLWDAGYRYTTMVQNAGYGSGRVMRCRPMFPPPWKLVVEIAFDPEEIDPATLALIVERSQRYGIGDYRPATGGEFGTFSAVLDVSSTARAARAPMGAKDRNGHEEAAHAASVARLTPVDVT